MTAPNNEDLKLIECYLAGELDAAGIATLEDRLRHDQALAEFFVEYASFDTSLKLNLKTEQSLASSLRQIENHPVAAPAINRRYSPWAIATAVSLMLLAGLTAWYVNFRPAPAVAWIVNAQNCNWNSDMLDRGRFQPNQVVEVKTGLLDIGFDSSARALIEGPAEVRILSDRMIELARGRISVKMPKGLSGFEVVTPQGRVLDLGTEFGVSVDGAGEVQLSVFDGEVMAFSKDQSISRKFVKDQSAKLQADQISVDDIGEKGFVRKIIAPPVRVPSKFFLAFDRLNPDAQAGIRDSIGNLVELNRLESTGSSFVENDPNVELDVKRGVLHVTATRSDINYQRGLDQGEYFGLKLSELGFTGDEDFEIRMNVLDTPSLEGFAQYGIYIADNARQCVRGGVIRWANPNEYRQFLVNTVAGLDQDGNQIGYISPGSDIEISFRRMEGKYSLTVKDLANENSNTLQIRHPAFLDRCDDLQVGIFVANPFHDKHATVTFDSFGVTVWKQSPVDEIDH